MLLFQKLKFVSSLFLFLTFYSCKPDEDPIKPKDHIPLLQKIMKFDTKNDTLVVDGYLNKFAFNKNELATLYLNSFKKADNVTIGIYDINGKLVSGILCNTNSQKMSTIKPWENGYGYQPTTTFNIPNNLLSGVYFIGNKIPFLIKNSSPFIGEILIVHPSHTDIAYNNNGGYSLYYPSHQNRARILSTQRPWKFAENGNPIPFYQWLSKTNYKIDYISDDEMQDYVNINSYKLIILAGHSEYWTRKARMNFDKFVDDGKNALLLTGNSMYWQTRMDFVKNQLICYKYDAAGNDPITDPLLKTTKWEDASLKNNQLFSIGLNYYNYGGTITSRSKNTKGFDGYKIIKPESPIFAGLGLKRNDVITHNSIEYDGANVKFEKDSTNQLYPVYDNSVTKFYKVDILGWDYAIPDWGLQNNVFHTGLCVLFKKKNTSGLILNMSSSNWCNEIGTKPQLKTITKNAIDFLLKENDFSQKAIIQ